MPAIARSSQVFIAFPAFIIYIFSAGCLNQRWQMDDSPGEIAYSRKLSPKFRPALSSGNLMPREVGYRIASAELSNPFWIKGLETELTKAGAHIGADGRLYDFKNKEIYLWVRPNAQGGTHLEPPAPSAEKQEDEDRIRRAFEDLKQRYRVIELPNPLPAPP